MAHAVLPSSTATRESWLDRPVFPAWRRIAMVAAYWEIAAYALLVAAGFLLRVWDVGSRAMHHDESLHAYYAWKLFAGMGYAYDPLMHGPLQFEVVPLFYLLFGAGETAARLLAVVTGTILIVLPYFLRSHLTRAGALLSGLMLAISPAFVYFSRFIRDDMYLACFSMMLFIALVKYLETHQSRYLYLTAVAAALAVASMEAAYITFFTFGTFLAAVALREFLSARNGPVLLALRATKADTWLTAVAVLVVITVLLYSTFFSNPYGIWDTQHSLCLSNCLSLHPVWNTARKDVLGGITYWLAQHTVQRGGQPWFYYLLVLPLYEQLAVVFGLVGTAYALMRRNLVRSFLVWWAVIGLFMYSWAGEKMPWLSIHIALPFILLAGLVLGAAWERRGSLVFILVGAVFVPLLALEIHGTFLLNFQNGANPTEMLIYVQSSPDVPKVAQEINTIAHRTSAGVSMPIGLDNADVGGWPFLWYLRDYTRITESATFSGPVCGGQYCPVMLMLEPEYLQYRNQLDQHYVVQKYRWNWWFPEDYKQWFPQHWSNIPSALSGTGSLTGDLLGNASDHTHLWNWLMYRTPFGERSARWLYMLVNRDLVPGASKYTTGAVGSGTQTLPAVQSHLRSSMGGSGGLNGPRGIAVDPNGNLFAADTLNHRITVFGRSGNVIRRWGAVGSGPGQFSANNSPQSSAVGPDNLLYAADTWNQRIQVFTLKGRLVRQWGGGPIGNAPGSFYGPRSVAVAPNGRVYVADTGNKRIQVFTRKGAYISSWGTPGAGPGQFNEPSAIAVGPGGQVYVADFWNQRVQVFTGSGSYLREWRVSDWMPQSYDEPYIAVGSRTGRVFVTDPAQHQALEYTSRGHLIGAFGGNQLTLPIGIAALQDGTIAVSDAASNQVKVFSVAATGSSAAHSQLFQKLEKPKKVSKH